HHEADHEGDARPVEIGAPGCTGDLDRHEEKRRHKQEKKQDADHLGAPELVSSASIWVSCGAIASAVDYRRCLEPAGSQGRPPAAGSPALSRSDSVRERKAGAPAAPRRHNKSIP